MGAPFNHHSQSGISASSSIQPSVSSITSTGWQEHAISIFVSFVRFADLWLSTPTSSSYFLGEATWPTRSPRDCTGSTFPYESSSNSVCWLSGASTGLHLLILQTTSSRLVQLKDGQIYDQQLPASCAFRAQRLWQSAHGHSLLALRLLGTISQWIFVILILVFLVLEKTKNSFI